MKLSKMVLAALSATVISATSFYAQAAGATSRVQVAATPSVFLQLEITSNCTDKGAVFKIYNRGTKWPRTGFLRLYHADSKTPFGERRLRLGQRQRVSFVVKDEAMKGHPVAVWVDPEWYKREFGYDANVSCD